MSSCCECRPLSSIQKKYAMAITGLLLCGFLLVHLAGNFTLLIGPEKFNKYSHALISNPFIYVMEAGLALLFLSHLAMGIRVTLENKKARPQAYYMRKHSGRGATFASSTMPMTGMVGLVFLIVHIVGIKFGTHYDVTYDGVVMRDIYKTTVEYFQNPMSVIYYIISVVALGIHVSHGFWSAFQSLGFNHPKYMPKLQTFSLFFGFLIAVGFSIFPIFCFLQGGN